MPAASPVKKTSRCYWRRCGGWVTATICCWWAAARGRGRSAMSAVIPMCVAPKILRDCLRAATPWCTPATRKPSAWWCSRPWPAACRWWVCRPAVWRSWSTRRWASWRGRTTRQRSRKRWRIFTNANQRRWDAQHAHGSNNVIAGTGCSSTSSRFMKVCCRTAPSTHRARCAPMAEPALCVSLHDVAPATWPASRRLLRGWDMLTRRLHWPIAGFVAPAWLLGPGARAALTQLPFRYTTTLRSIYRLPDWHETAAPSLVYSVRSAWRRALSRRWNRWLYSRSANLPLLRAGLHPADADHPDVVDDWCALLQRALEQRRPPTKRDWVEGALQ